MPNDLRFRTLSNYEITRKPLIYLELMGKYLVGHPKGKFWELCYKIAKNKIKSKKEHLLMESVDGIPDGIRLLSPKAE